MRNKVPKRQWVLLQSLKAAAREQNLAGVADELRGVIPDLSDQYTQFKVEGDYLEANVRLLHAFQMSLIRRVISEFKAPVVVDIGDSSGTHVRYAQALLSKDRPIRALSVNLDPEAVKRIKGKGLEAILSRAEDLKAYQVNADIFLCFEVMEHMLNPGQFLYDLATKTQAKYFIATVPFVRQSRIVLKHIRENRTTPVCAENTHIFEFSPDDWRVLVQHAGWRVVADPVYYQYPRRGFWRITKPLWVRDDYEGFYGMILTRDLKWSSMYKDW